MYNPTRRAKRFKRPLSSTWPLHGRPETSGILPDVPGEDHTTSTSPSNARHRQAVQPDALRGAMLVALIVVTIVLYIVLWELERSSSMSNPIQNQSMTATSPLGSGHSDATLAQHSPAIPVSGEELGLLNSDQIAALATKRDRATSNTWPPPIVRVPEEPDTDVPTERAGDRSYKNESVELPSFDSAYCDGTCRFLLPFRIGEQESKARVHFRHLLTLARRLNRTIVLPNVGKSRMGACSKWPFDAYYDTREFVHSDGSPDSPLAMDLDRFVGWIDKRPVPSSGFVVSMKSIPRDRRDVLRTQAQSRDAPFIVRKEEVDPKILSCLESKSIPLHHSLPEVGLSMLFDSDSLKTEHNPSTDLVKFLSDNPLDMSSDSDIDLMVGPGYPYTSQYANSSYLSLADIDVLVLDYDLRYPLFLESTLPNINLHYAPPLYDLADRLSDHLDTFLGVHWRMENVPVQNLAWCAVSLVSTLRTLLQDDIAGKNVRHVWFATDHPRPLSSFVDGGRMSSGIESWKNGSALQKYGPLVKSSTFKALSSEHDHAIAMLAEAFRPGGDLDAWKLTDLAEQLARYPYIEGKFDLDEALLSDPGVFGILDKLVIVQSRTFLSGSAGCGKTSSFSRQVIETRRESFEAERGKGTVRNVVEYFGKW